MGVIVDVACTGMKPEYRPVTLVNMETGRQGWSKVD